jgi:3-hydroxyacyl-CoA dehydrogenase
VEGYRPVQPASFRLPGESGRAALGMAVGQMARLGKATPHDVTVCDHLARTLTGTRDHTEETREEEVLRLERQGFMALLRSPATLARVEHMLETGRPLRN